MIVFYSDSLLLCPLDGQSSLFLFNPLPSRTLANHLPFIPTHLPLYSISLMVAHQFVLFRTTAGYVCIYTYILTQLLFHCVSTLVWTLRMFIYVLITSYSILRSFLMIYSLLSVFAQLTHIYHSIHAIVLFSPVPASSTPSPFAPFTRIFLFTFLFYFICIVLCLLYSHSFHLLDDHIIYAYTNWYM